MLRPELPDRPTASDNACLARPPATCGTASSLSAALPEPVAHVSPCLWPRNTRGRLHQPDPGFARGRAPSARVAATQLARDAELALSARVPRRNQRRSVCTACDGDCDCGRGANAAAAGSRASEARLLRPIESRNGRCITAQAESLIRTAAGSTSRLARFVPRPRGPDAASCAARC